MNFVFIVYTIMNKIVIYLKYFITFICGQIFATWAQFYTMKNPGWSVFKSTAVAMPFAWIDWIFLTYAIDLSNKHNLLTHIQNIFTLIMIQVGLFLIMMKYFLKKPLYKSDYVSFLLIFIAFAISYQNYISKLFKIKIPEAIDKKNNKEIIQKIEQKIEQKIGQKIEQKIENIEQNIEQNI